MVNFKINRVILSSIISFGLTTSAFAIVPEQSFYLGGQIGTSHNGVNTQHKDDTYILSVNKSGLAGRVFGGYQFNKNIAAELGYSKFSDVKLKSENGGTAKQQGLDLVAKGTIPLDYGVGLFAEGGIAYVDNKINPTSNSIHNPTIRDRRYSPVFGAGVSYDIQNVRLNGGWRRIQHNAGFQNIDIGYVGAAIYLG